MAEFEHKYELPRMKKDEIDSLPTIALEETDTASGRKVRFSQQSNSGAKEKEKRREKEIKKASRLTGIYPNGTD